MAKLVIINQPLFNRGDQAAFRALVRLLKTVGELEIEVLFCTRPEGAAVFMDGMEGVGYRVFPRLDRKKRFYKRLLWLPAFLQRAFRRFPEAAAYAQYIRKADFVLCAPGGIDIGGYQNWKDLWQLYNALAMKKWTGIWGRSIGPFGGSRLSDKRFKRLAVEMLRQVRFLSLRDKQSRDIAEGLGIPYVPTIDTAFAYRPECEIPEELSAVTGGRYAAFVPNQLYAWHKNFRRFGPEPFAALYKAVIRNIVTRGYRVVMIPQLFGRAKVDRPYFESLAEEYGRDKAVVLADTYDSDVQQAVIRNASFVAGARCHSVIFAINNHVPFLCLSYEHKMDGMLELLGLSEYSLPLSELLEADADFGRVVKLLETVIEQREFIVPRIQEAQLNARRIVQTAFDKFSATMAKE